MTVKAMKIRSSRLAAVLNLLAACILSVTWISFLLQPAPPGKLAASFPDGAGRNHADKYWAPVTHHGYIGPYIPDTSVIFYNAYFASGNEEHGLHIVKEQLDQIALTDRLVTIYFHTIGSPVLSPIFLDKLCAARNMTCQLLSHYRSAKEDVTLQELFNFCQDQQDDDNGSLRVAYVHNKGSLNSRNGTNDLWRRHLTAAAMTEDCWNPPSNATCHVCGLQFWPLWTPFFPGNMWTAQCSYVRKLLPPTGFDVRKDSFYEKILQLERQGIIMNRVWVFPMSRRKELNDFQKGLLGIDRWALEHWVGSHPDLQPCDVAGDLAGDLDAWIESSNHSGSERHFVWSMAPHAPVRPLNYWWALSKTKNSFNQAMRAKRRRMKEYFLLPGLLHKWIYLYNQTPPSSSWVWSWYPDRVIWRKRAEKLGVKVLDTLQP